MPSGAVKVSFLAASDSDRLMRHFKLAMARMLVASLDDLMA